VIQQLYQVKSFGWWVHYFYSQVKKQGRQRWQLF